MKANEVMLGDWVFNEVPCYVTAIYPNGTMDCQGDDWAISTDRVDPIPLTAEILKKNGFEKPTINDPFKNYVFKDTFIHKEQLPNVELLRVNYYDGVEWDFYALLGERESSDCGEQYEYIIIVKFVHELQHALRLCGINKEIII